MWKNFFDWWLLSKTFWQIKLKKIFIFAVSLNTFLNSCLFNFFETFPSFSTRGQKEQVKQHITRRCVSPHNPKFHCEHSTCLYNCSMLPMEIWHKYKKLNESGITPFCLCFLQTETHNILTYLKTFIHMQIS